jgi:hypothetical protein
VKSEEKKTLNGKTQFEAMISCPVATGSRIFGGKLSERNHVWFTFDFWEKAPSKYILLYVLS